MLWLSMEATSGNIEAISATAITIARALNCGVSFEVNGVPLSLSRADSVEGAVKYYLDCLGKRRNRKDSEKLPRTLVSCYDEVIKDWEDLAEKLAGEVSSDDIRVKIGKLLSEELKEMRKELEK